MPHDDPHPEEGERVSPSVSPDVALAISFVAEAGRQMLESSSSVSEVVETLRGFLPVVGLEGCALDANLSSLTLSYWGPGQPVPLTTMLVVSVSAPRLERLSTTTSLLDRVANGEIGLEAALRQLRTLRDAPGRSGPLTRGALLVSVVGWVLFINGLDAITVLVALFATLLTFPLDSIVLRLRMPGKTGTFLAALVLAAVPNLLAGAGLSFSVGAAVVGCLFIYLPGRALVSSVIDGLANAPVSAMSRGLEAVITAGALALGISFGAKIGAGLGVHFQPDVTAAPIAISVLAAALGVFGIAIAWGMPGARVLPAVGTGAFGWLIVALLAREGDGTDWAVYLLAAMLVGLSGVISASLQKGTASVYTGVAILPLVPGFSLYEGMLALTQGSGGNGGAGASLADAVAISLAVAGGVAVGLGIGLNLRATGGWVAARRKDLRR